MRRTIKPADRRAAEGLAALLKSEPVQPSPEDLAELALEHGLAHPAASKAHGGPRQGSHHRSPREKAATVVLATIEGIPAAAIATGIPKRTVASWMDDPQWQELASRATEEIAADAKVLAQMAMKQVKEQLPDASAWDASRIATQMTQIEALRLGKPTAITETKDVTERDEQSIETLLAAAQADRERRGREAPAARGTAGDPSAPSTSNS